MPLRQGSRGEDVRAVQRWLNRLGEIYSAIPPLTEDGIFGPATALAVRTWQRIAGLDPTGVISSFTWDSLASAYRAVVEGEYGDAAQFGGSMGA